jgi:hypothetical protein
MRLLTRSLEPESLHLITSNLEDVVPDLRDLSLDEIFEFREAHGMEFRGYMEQLYMLVIQFVEAVGQEESVVLTGRLAELAQAAEDLRRIIRKWWRCPIRTMGIAVFAATWRSAQRNGGASGVPLLDDTIGGQSVQRNPAGVFSYLIRDQWSLVHGKERLAPR